MTVPELALIDVHRENIRHYEWLLTTNLAEVERRFVERRIDEECSIVNQLLAQLCGEHDPDALQYMPESSDRASL